MPTYDYRCPNGHDFERFVRKISEAEGELICPVCGAMAERRVSGGAGLVFKGSGFYLTDYGKNAHRKGASDAGTGQSKSETSSGGGDSAKADSTSSGGAKPETTAGTSKPESAKSSESKPSSKSKGGDTK
jgi:putative FmdB family regulatory protein